MKTFEIKLPFINIWNNGRTIGFRGGRGRFTFMVCKRVEPFFRGCFNWYVYIVFRRDWVGPAYFRIERVFGQSQ